MYKIGDKVEFLKRDEYDITGSNIFGEVVGFYGVDLIVLLEEPDKQGNRAGVYFKNLVKIA